MLKKKGEMMMASTVRRAALFSPFHERRPFLMPIKLTLNHPRRVYMFARNKRSAIVTVLALCLAVAALSHAEAVTMEGANSSTGKLTFGGDLRIRQESF